MMTVSAGAFQNGTATSSGTDRAVLDRYRDGAERRVEALCCPVQYDASYLKIIPPEIIERDYGCGDPSRYVRPGETVLDLGSGSGKIAYIAAQIVGNTGKVIGVDFNPAMLQLSRQYQGEIAEKLGYDAVEFRRGRIQDLALNLDALDALLERRPVKNAGDVQWLQDTCEELRLSQPLVASNSIDVVLSNCVLNLVNEREKRQLFAEIFRVTKVGGRVAISDIVCDEPVPELLKADPELWSGCISGAFEEEAFLKAFEDAGFYGISIVKRDAQPWQVIQGIEFRSVTVTAHKGKQGPCYERNQAVVYKGPFKKVVDDDGHILERGARQAVCDKTFRLYASEPYSDHFYFVEPVEEIAIERKQPFDCGRSAKRHPRETKGLDYNVTTKAAECCGPDGCAC